MPTSAAPTISAAGPPGPLVEMAVCREVSLSFDSGSGPVEALRGIDAAFRAGAVATLMGPTGSGKSSLLRVLAGHDRPSAGTVTVAGTEISRLGRAGRRRLRRRTIGFVFQRPAANLLPYLDVAGHLRLGAQFRGRADPAEADALLDRLGLDHRRSHLPGQLSGGEQQRVAFAVAAMGRPPLLLADEPTAELDHASAAQLLESIRILADLGTCVILSSHDPLVADHADQVVRLDHGRRVASGAGR